MADEFTQKTVLRCIICGEALIKSDAVRYSGALAHKTCTQKTIVEKTDSFKRGFLYLGSIGVVIVVAMLLASTIGFSQPVSYSIAFAGTAIGFLIQSAGFVGIARNYDLPQGFACTILSIFNSIAFALASSIVLVAGNNPDYYTEEGILLLYEIPYLGVAIISAYLLTGLIMVIFAIIIAILEDQLNPLYPNYIISIILIISAAFVTGSPVNILCEFILVTFVFLIAGPPPAWSDVSELQTPYE